jgi:hypothetical protein
MQNKYVELVFFLNFGIISVKSCNLCEYSLQLLCRRNCVLPEKQVQ